jgi:hypothetical protein
MLPEAASNYTSYNVVLLQRSDPTGQQEYSM